MWMYYLFICLYIGIFFLSCLIVMTKHFQISDSDALCSLLTPEAPAPVADGNTSTSYVPDSTPTQLVPSLQSWPGQYDFKISLSAENKDRNKVKILLFSEKCS